MRAYYAFAARGQSNLGVAHDSCLDGKNGLLYGLTKKRGTAALVRISMHLLIFAATAMSPEPSADLCKEIDEDLGKILPIFRRHRC